MKNQYVGDIGDFGKYSLLRFLANAGAGIKVGVNWYLTDNDGTSDGKHTKYLKRGELRSCDEYVFDALGKIAYHGDTENTNKQVKDVKNEGIIPGAVFYPAPLRLQGSLEERKKERNKWFENSISELKEANLIFMDPDNGLLTANRIPKRSYEKYVLPDEVKTYFKAGNNVVYYCHKGRRTNDKWTEYKQFMFKDKALGAHPIILTYHKGTQRSYVFLIHEENFDVYRDLIADFLSNWDSSIFHEEGLSYDIQSFQKLHPSRAEKEKALRYMTDCQIDELIESTSNKTAKTFYTSYKRGGINNPFWEKGSINGPHNFKDVFEFQEAYPSKVAREDALRNMTNKDIDRLVETCGTKQGKAYYASFKKVANETESDGFVLDETRGIPVYGQDE